jgi:hypothetical protein
MADDARQGQGRTSGSTSYSTWRHAFVVSRGGEYCFLPSLRAQRPQAELDT